MKVRTVFIHPKNGLQDISILQAPSVEHVVGKLKEIGCEVLTAEEEKDSN
jgi:hypothetical protein